MAESIKKALPGSDPSNAIPAYGIQSKAVSKDTNFKDLCFTQTAESL
jgi:hypothetical protein